MVCSAKYILFFFFRSILICHIFHIFVLGMPIDRALTRERQFFERHPAYRAVANRCGSAHLSRILSHLMLAAIRSWIPRVRGEVSLMLQTAENELASLGPSVDTIDTASAGQTVLRLLTRYASNFCDMVEGRTHADASDDLLTRVLFGGARIQEHVRSRFASAVGEWMRGFVSSAHTTLPSSEILMALRNSAGARPALFIPEAAFVALVRRFVSTLREQGRRFVQHIYDELRRVADHCQPPQLERFGDLQERAVEVVHDLLRTNFVPCQAQVDKIIDFELSHVNTLHPDFVGADGAAAAVSRGADIQIFYSPEVPFDPVYEDTTSSYQSMYQGKYIDGDNVSDGYASASEIASRNGDPRPVSDNENENVRNKRGSSSSNNARSSNAAADVLWAVRHLGGVLATEGSQQEDDVTKVKSKNGRGRARDRERNNNNSRGNSRNRDPSANPDSSSNQDPDALKRMLAAHFDGEGNSVASVQDEASDPKNASTIPSTGSVDPVTGLRPVNSDIGDVSARFAKHIVSDIAGHGPEDPVPVGAVRVGSAHSPFVARPSSRLPRGSVGPAATVVASNDGVSAVASPSRGGVSYSYNYGSPSELKGKTQDAVLSPRRPGATLSYSADEFSKSINSSSSESNSKRPYVHYDLLQLPSRPLPSVITPADLRPTLKEKTQVRIVRYLLLSYLQIVAKTYQDMVPKVVMSMLVHKSRDEVASTLVHTLYKDISSPDLLLRETDEVASRRSTLSAQAKLLRRAIDVLGEIRDSANGGVASARDLVGPTHSAPDSLAAPISSNVTDMHATSSSNVSGARINSKVADAIERDFSPWRLGVGSSHDSTVGPSASTNLSQSSPTNSVEFVAPMQPLMQMGPNGSMQYFLPITLPTGGIQLVPLPPGFGPVPSTVPNGAQQLNSVSNTSVSTRISSGPASAPINVGANSMRSTAHSYTQATTPIETLSVPAIAH
jgi:Dynamin central region/Dynamin GTPase effector domain